MYSAKQIIVAIILSGGIMIGTWVLVKYPTSTWINGIEKHDVKINVGDTSVKDDENNSTNTTNGGGGIIGSAPGVTDTIHMTSQATNQTITSPVTVQGEAKGSWFFEANMRGSIVDSEGNTVKIFPIAAKTDWMTSDFVPFAESVSFTSPGYGQKGFIVIENDNPSGLLENSKSIKIPVKFK